MYLNLVLQEFVQIFKNSTQSMGLMELSEDEINFNFQSIAIAGQLDFFINILN